MPNMPIGDDDYNQDDFPSPLIRHPLSTKYGEASVDEIVARLKTRCDMPEAHNPVNVMLGSWKGKGLVPEK